MMMVNRFVASVLDVDEKPSLNQAQALLAHGDHVGAAEICQAVLRDLPNNSGALHLLGVALGAAGLHAAALPWLERAIAAGDAAPALLHDYGMTLRALGRMGEAVFAFRLAAEGNPDDADAWFALGTTRLALEQYGEAATALQSAVELAPKRADICRNLSLALIGLGLAQQRRCAFDVARATLAAAVQKAPENARAHAYLGNVLRDLGRFADAHAQFARARALAPDDAEVIANEGLVWQHEGDLDQAIDCYTRAIELQPNSEPLRSNLAQALLLAGRFEEGWTAFEHRFADPATAAQVASLPGARWRGEEVAGKILLLRCEQGLGDAIQFARYVPVLSGMGARVSLVGPARLARLMAGLGGLSAYIAEDDRLPHADFHAPLISVPHLLRSAAIPAQIPYLSAEPDLIARWGSRLAQDARLRIGIAWQGNPTYGMDYLRSIPPLRMAEMIVGIDARFISLQHGGGLHAPVAAGAQDFGAELDREHAFVDTAAMMANLDLVITSDTAIAHLAGALGRPAWVLLPYAPDWRWRLGRSDCDWYPSLRLFRQPRPGDWDGVMAAVRRALGGDG